MRSVLSMLAFFGLIAGQFLAVVAVYSMWHGKRSHGSRKVSDEAGAPNDRRSAMPTSARRV
jgi:hypothetical protein